MTETDAPRSPVSVVESSLPTDQLELARANGSSVVILPRKRAVDGRGIYGEATVFPVKELRTNGLDVAFLDPSEGRLFEVKKSALVVAFVTIALGIVSTASWDGIKALLRRNHVDDNQMEITYTDLSPDGNGRTWTVRGLGKDVLDAIDKLTDGPPDDER